MDKDEFLKILESTSCHNIDNYVYDREWSLLSGLTHAQDKNKQNRNLRNFNLIESQIASASNSNKKEKNILKILDNELEESQFYEKIKKDAEDFRISSSHKFANEFHSNMEQIYQNKALFFNKFAKSKAKDRYKYPALSILNNFTLEKNYLKKQIQEYFPGLKPSSSWPMALDDLIEKLSKLNLEEMFHQPFDTSNNMHNEAKEFIRYYYNALKTEKVDESQVPLYREYLEKAIQAFITVKIHEGSYTNFLDMLSFLKQINQESQASENSKKLFTEIFANAMEKCGSIFEKLSSYILSLSETLPLMRNYSVSDLFYISKNILFSANNKSPSSTHSNISITTDSSFLYIVMSGVGGSMLKVGTGSNATEKGKVYLSRQFDSDDSVTWVFCKQKLYLKKSSNEMGCLEIINPQTLQTEGKIKLMINESCMHSLIKKKNENFVLLSDGEKLKIIVLEQKLNPNAEESLLDNIQDELSKQVGIQTKKSLKPAVDEEDFDSDEECGLTEAEKLCLEKKAKEISKLFSYISVILYEYDVENSAEKQFDEEKENLILELEETFSQLYSKSECKKALLMLNWDFEKAALFLIDKAEKIKEPLLLPCRQLTLFQSKIDPMVIESRNSEYRKPLGTASIFDIVLFDEFKWVNTDRHLIAYKLRGGYAYLFSLDEQDVRFIKPQEYQAFEENYDEEGEKEMKEKSEEAVKIKKDKSQDVKKVEDSSVIDNNNSENIDSKIAHKKESEDKLNEQEDKRLDRKLAKKYIRGSFLKKVNAIELTKLEYAITFDKKTHSYYLLTDSFSTQSIIKINTMEEHYKSITDQYLKANGYESIQDLINKFNDKNETKDFGTFYENFLDVLFIVNTRKPDLYSKYRNWNIYLFSQFDRLYNAIDLDSEGDYPKKLLYYMKIMQSRFEKTLEYDYQNIKKHLDTKLLENYQVVKNTNNSNTNIRKYKIKKKVDENTNKNIKINLDMGKWFFFANYSSVDFELKQESKTIQPAIDKDSKDSKNQTEEKEEISKRLESDLDYYFENKIEYYLCPEGNVNSLEMVLNILNDAYEDFKNKKNDVERLIKKMFLLYSWFESADVSVVLQFADSNNSKNDLDSNENKRLLKQTFSKALDLIENLYETSETKIRNLVFMIVLCGWEFICFDAESQVKWFLRAHEHSQMLLKSFNKPINLSHLAKNKKIQLENLTIESKIAKIALLNAIDKEQFSSEHFMFLPFSLLLERLKAMNTHEFPYLFHRVNQIRIFTFKLKENDPKLISFKQLEVKANPKNFVFPFHWILNRFYLKYFSFKGKLKEEEFKDIRKKIYEAQILNKEKSSENECQTSSYYHVYYENPNVLFSRGFEFNSFENNLKYFKLLKSGLVNNQDRMEDKCNFDNENIIEFYNVCNKLIKSVSEITSNSSEYSSYFIDDVIDLQTNSFLNLVGDLYLLKDFEGNLQLVDKEKLNLNNTEVPDPMRNYELYIENFYDMIISNYESIKKLIQITLEAKQNNNHEFFKSLRNNVLKNLTFFFYSTFMFMKKLNLSQQKSLNEKFIEILNYITAILQSMNNTNDQSLFEKLIKLLKTYSSNGFQIENEKYCELVLNPNEPLNLNELVNFPEAASIAVEIEYNIFNQERSKLDLTVISQEHGYNNYKNHNSYNSNNNFGTAFLIEIGMQNIKKRLFLPGKEIKILNANEGRIRYQGRESTPAKNQNINSTNNPKAKNILRIKCYPIKNQNYLYNNSNENKALLDKLLGENQMSENEFLLWLDYLTNLDYILNWAIQTNIKSIEVSKEEKTVLENGLFANLYKLGLEKYADIDLDKIKIKEEEINSNAPNDKINVLDINNNSNASMNSDKADFEFLKGKSFQESFEIIYASIIEKINSLPNNKNNLMEFTKTDRKSEIYKVCELNWSEVCEEMVTKNAPHNFIFEYIISELEDGYGFDLQSISYAKIKEDIVKAEAAEREKMLAEAKAKEAPVAQTNENPSDNEKEKDKEIIKNPYAEFYKKFLDEKNINYMEQTKEFIHYFLNLLVKINESNEALDLKAEKNILFDLLRQLKSLVPEPNNYRMLKMMPSFNHKMKNIWIVIETLFLYCLTYHLNISSATSLELLTKEIPNIQSALENNNNNNIKNVLEFLGKKLNSLIFWMTSRVQFMKDTFDTIKYQSEIICEKNNEFLSNVKTLCLDKIASLKKEKEEKIRIKLEEEEKLKSAAAAQSKKDKSKKPKEENKAPEKSALEKLKEEMGSGNKPLNFKKKSNAKRLYQDISSKKKSAPASAAAAAKKDEKEIKENAESKKDAEEDEKYNVPADELNKKSLEELFKLFPELKSEFMNKENIKLMKEGIKTAIENDIKDAFFGNNEKLKNICEINEIAFSESNPNESLKNYFNFILGKLKSIYDFDEVNVCTEMNAESVLDKIYKDSPYKILSDYVLEKILFLLELGNDNLINILDQNTNANNNLTKVNNILRKSLSKKPYFANNPAELKGNEITRKSDEEGFLTINQTLIVKAIFNFIYKSPSAEMIRSHLNSQNKRMLIRQLGFDKLKNLILNNSYKNISFISLNNMGILSSTLNSSILNGIETTIRKFDAKNLNLESTLSFNLYHINNEINDFLLLGKNNYSNFSFLKTHFEKDQSEGNKRKALQNIEVSNIETFYVHKLKNLVLILSDINMLVTYLSNMQKHNSLNIKSILNAESRLENTSEGELSIPIDILKNFINSSIKIIINSEINSYAKITKNISSFSSILKSVLGKLITNKNNEAIYTAVLDSLFTSLEEFELGTYDEQINSVVNILDIIYHIVSMLPQGNFNFVKAKANLNKLLNVILNSNIPHIVNLSCKIAKIFLKNIYAGNSNSKLNSDLEAIEEEIYKSIYEKIGKLWAFKNNQSDKASSLINSKNKSNLETAVEANNKRYYLFVQLNSPEFDYLFLINALFQWEEIYPTNLSAYKQHIIKTLDDNFNEEEQQKLLDAYNKKCEKDEFLNFYKINAEELKQKYNSKNFNSHRNTKNEFKVQLHKFKEMVYFNPLKVKTGKTHNITEALNKSNAELAKSITEKTNRLTELQRNRENLVKEKEENNKKEEEKKDEKIEEKKEEAKINENISNQDTNSNPLPEVNQIENPLPSAAEPIPEAKIEAVSEPKKAEGPVLSIEEEEYILKNEIEILKIKELYNKRLSEHVKTAELIGENASGRGFVVIDGGFTKEKAEQFSNLVWKAYYKLLPCVLNPDSIFIPPFKKYEAPVKTETADKAIELNGHCEKAEASSEFKTELEAEAIKNLEKYDVDFIKELNYIFDDSLIWPKLHDYAALLPGCTNILKETTKQYLNISLMENSVYQKFAETMNNFNERLFLKTDQDVVNSKRPITGNFNEIGKKILNDKLINGKSIYIILEDLISLIISPNLNNQQGDSESPDFNISLIAKLLNNNLKEISSEKWEKEITDEKKYYILGLLIVSSGFFNVLRHGSIALLNNNPKDVCKIISGGHLTGKLSSNVIFLKDKSTKIEKVLNANLNKLNPLDFSAKNKINNLANNELALVKGNPSDCELKLDGGFSKQSSFTNAASVANKIGTFNINANNNNASLNLIDLVNIEEIINAIDSALDIFKANPNSQLNQNLIFFLLKFFSVFEHEDFLRNANNKSKISDIFSKLNSLTEAEKWIERSEQEWELEYIESWQRVYTKLDKNSNLFYSPSKGFLEELRSLYQIPNASEVDSNNEKANESSNPKFQKKQNFLSLENNPNELISKLTMPDSAYGADLPKLTDYSKCTLALKNIQSFERYTVEEIFRYCANTYKDYEFLNSLQQIRYHLSNNDTSSAKTDIYYIFDQTKVPPHMPLPKEHRDMHEVFKEECYPGNYYLAKINARIARESGINYLLKLSNLGLNEVPVLLLLADTSINQALVQFDDYTDQSRINSFWISLDCLFALDYQPKVPASAYSFETLQFEFNYIQSSLIKLYAKNILINLNKYKLNLNAISLNSYVNMALSASATATAAENSDANAKINIKGESEFNMKNLIHFLNLEFWQLNKLSPITGIFSSFKNYIKVKQLDDLTFRSKESFVNQDNSASLDLNEVLSELNNQKKSKLNQALTIANNLVNPNLQRSSYSENNMEEIEKYLCELCSSNEENLKLLKNWCFESWENLFKDTKHLKFDLFQEYILQLGQMRTAKQFNLGNMGNKLLALHELADLNSASFCGVILSFEQTAVLGPNAKLSFYSDKDGVNLIYEITAIKNTMSNLQSIIFNHSKIWMNYTPGTRAFYIHDWHIQTRDSELPCCLSFIPYYWSSLIWISDFTTSSLFASYSFENLEIFKEYIKKLLGFCSSTKIPVDLQRNIFNITNRIILKANKYIQELENKQLISFEGLSLYEKMAIIGIDEFMLIELIKHIDRFNTNNNSDKKDKNFSSSYVVDGVEIILSILSVIKESYHNLDFYFKENFDYSLPIWIEAIIKLGQFLNLFQNVSQLESELLREIKNEAAVKDQIYDLFVIKNIPGYIENQKLIEEIKKLAASFNIQISDSDIDIQVIDKAREKYDMIFNESENGKNKQEPENKQNQEVVIEAKKDEVIEKADESANKTKHEVKIEGEEVKQPVEIKVEEEVVRTDLEAKADEKEEEPIENKFANIDMNYTKEICILIDGVKIETLREVAETAEVEEASSLWICAGCEMENDNENVMCIFCDKEKTVKPKEKKKKTLMKVDSYNQTVNDILTEFKNTLKNNSILNTFSYQVPIVIVKEPAKAIAPEKPEIQAVTGENSEVIKAEENPKVEVNVLDELPFIEECDYGTLKETKEKNKEKKEEINTKQQKVQEEKITKDLEVSSPEEIKRNKSSFSDTLADFYRFRTARWIENSVIEFLEILKSLKHRKHSAQKSLNALIQLAELSKSQPELFKNSFLNSAASITNSSKSSSNSLNSESSNSSAFEANNLSDLNFLNLMQDLEANSIDTRFEVTELSEAELRENINLEVLEKIREVIDLNICKETNISFVFPPKAVRFAEEEANSINCYNSALIKKAIKPFKYCLAQIRYYWSIIKYFNNCLLAALPFIKPPDMNSDSSLPKDAEFTYIPFQKSISAFLSSAKGLTFAFTKQNLIREVIAYTEFPEEQIQIPTFKFERLNIFNNLTDDKSSDKKKGASGDPAFIRNDNLVNSSNQIDNGNNSLNHANNGGSGEIEDDENTNNGKEMKLEESMFLQAYDQFKDIDIAFFRSKKAPGDPHIGFKVEFKGELVQGIGGPYRQFFSDISAELQPKDVIGNAKILKLLYPSSNNQAEKGDFKDKYVIRPLLTDNNSVNQFEFLGVLMGICIRTGVHLTLDLCSIFWKKITEEALNVDDIREFDEGLLEQINFLKNEIDQETFENSLNKNYCIELTDNTLFELIPGGSDKKVNFEDRFTYMKMVIKARLSESDMQIAAIKRGLCKVVPYSLIKLMTYKELEQLVCGKKTIDIDLLKSYTVYSMELTAESNRNKWLWEILSEISEEEKVKFIKFCWGQERLPATKEEYEKLQINFKIKPNIDKNRKDIFPKADTCFFSLELPEYTSKDIMKRLILMAVNYDNVSINADKITTENFDHRRDDHYRDGYEYDSE